MQANFTKKRINHLDGIRGWAALFVVFSHLVGALDLKGIYLLNVFPFRVFWDGEFSVVVFFVLSGFVLYFGFHNSPNGHAYVRYCFRFILKRIFRIYPAFLVSIVMAVFLANCLNGAAASGYSDWIAMFWNQIIGFPELYKTAILLYPGLDTRLINPVIWTLAVELKVSLLFPVIVLPIVVLKNFRLLLGFTFVALLWGFFLNKDIFFQSSMFLVGAFICRAYLDSFFKKDNFVISAVLFLACYMTSLLFDDRASRLCQLLLVLSAVAIIFMSLTGKRFGAFMGLKVSQFLGDISYGLYLVHFPIILLLSKICPAQTAIEMFRFLLFSLILSFVFAWLLHRIVELPAISFAQRLLKPRVNNE